MNFFKSVFQDDDPPPSPPQHDDEDDEDQNPQSETLNPQSPTKQQQSGSEPESPNPQAPTWGFVGGLIKTFATKSESVIETYRRDLQEFSTGLKKETLTLKEVASSSLEVGASKAQESLESVGQAFDNIGSVVWSSTAQIIAQGKELDLDQNNNNNNNSNNISGGSNYNDVGLNLSSNSGKYSRFDAQLRGIQCDVNSFVEEIEDLADFEKWKLTFDLGGKSEEMGNLIKENGVMEGIYKRVVPNVVDHDVFWLRYFYRVHKLEQAESVRAKLVERANEDEDLSWDVDDDDEDEDDEQSHQSPIQQQEEQKQDEEREDGKYGDNVEVKKEEVVNEEESGDKGVVNSSNEVEVATDEAKVEVNEEDEGLIKKNGGGNVDEKAPSEGSKDSDISVVSSQPLSYREEEEDLGWDEIEDLGSDDDDDDVSGGDKKGKQLEGSGGSPSNREELRKRLSITEDDEDLSWDIEDDDDEPIKKN